MIDFTQYNTAEFLKAEEISHLQKTLFKQHFSYLARHSPYYKRVLAQAGVDIESVGIEALAALPFTDKSDFEKHNAELLAVPMSKVSDIVLSSGTTGKPTEVMYTEHDLCRLAYNEAVSFRRCGITSEDVVLLACTLDRCFVAGLAYFLGIRNIGAAAVRNGVSSFASHLEIIRRLKPTVIVGVPSFLRKLGLFIKSEGINPADLSPRKMVCIGEPLRDGRLSLLKLGEDLESLWGARVFSTYASTEMVTTFCECSAQQGGHLHPALALAEVVNTKGEVLPHGEAGELVVTPLSVEGMPLLRFKTGDISFLLDEPCTCGRYSYRLGPILGRKRQMIKYHGTTLYPQAIYTVLDNIPQVSEYYLSVSSNFDLSDELKVYISLRNNSCSADKIMDKLQSYLRVRPEVIISPDAEIKKQVYPNNSRKSIRFIDRRACHR
jgi:phenylacetate-CoA ligase